MKTGTRWRVVDNTIAWLCVQIKSGREGLAFRKIEITSYNLTRRHGDHWAESICSLIGWEEDVWPDESENLTAWQRLSELLHRAALLRLKLEPQTVTGRGTTTPTASMTSLADG